MLYLAPFSSINTLDHSRARTDLSPPRSKGGNPIPLLLLPLSVPAHTRERERHSHTAHARQLQATQQQHGALFELLCLPYWRCAADDEEGGKGVWCCPLVRASPPLLIILDLAPGAVVASPVLYDDHLGRHHDHPSTTALGCECTLARAAAPLPSPPLTQKNAFTPPKNKSPKHNAKQQAWQTIPGLAAVVICLTAGGFIREGVAHVYWGKPRPGALDPFTKALLARDAGVLEERRRAAEEAGK